MTDKNDQGGWPGLDNVLGCEENPSTVAKDQLFEEPISIEEKQPLDVIKK